MKVNTFTSPSSISEKEFKQIQAIIKKIESDSHSHIFHTPVPYKEWGLDEYIKIIRKPMDLSTVKSKLVQGLYTTPNDVFNDIQLIWDNCKRYNQEDSDIYKTAVIMEKHSDDLIQKQFSLPEKKRLNNPDYNIYSANEKDYCEKPILMNGQASLIEKFEIKNKFKSLDKMGINLLCNYLIKNIPNILKNKDCGFEIDFNILDLDSISKMTEFIKNYENERSERLQRESLENKHEISVNPENIMLVDTHTNLSEIKKEELNQISKISQEKI